MRIQFFTQHGTLAHKEVMAEFVANGETFYVIEWRQSMYAAEPPFRIVPESEVEGKTP